MSHDQDHAPRHWGLTVCALVVALALAATRFFAWPLFDSFFALAVVWECGLAVILACVTGIAALRCLRGRAEGLALVCGVLGFAAWIWFPFGDLWIRLDFKWKRTAREDVVGELERGEHGEIPIGNERLISLGANAPSVSAGGNLVVVERHDEGVYAFFYLSRGVLNNYLGILRVPLGGDPRRFGELADSTTRLEPLADGWVFARHW